MSNYINMVIKEKAFTDFIIQQKRKEEIIFKFYQLKSINGIYDCSFIGYETNTNGLFGVHFDKRRNSYYFGTRNKNLESTLTTLTYNQINEIPEVFKTLMLNVINSKNSMTIKKQVWKS